MRRFILSLVLFLFAFPSTSQDFPGGQIAYAQTIDCEPFGSCTSDIKIINPNTSESVIIATGEPNALWGESLSLSPDGRYIAYMTNDRVFHITNIETTQEVGTIEFYQDIYGSINYTWHPTQPLIAFVYKPEIESPYRLFLFGLNTHSWFPLVEDLSIQKWARPRWSPDEDFLLIPVLEGENYSNNTTDLYRIHIASGRYENLTNSPSTVWTADWLSNGQQIVYSTGETRQNQIVILDIETRNKEIIYTHEDALIAGTEWVLDESAILFWMNVPDSPSDFELYILDLATGDVQLVLAVPPYFSGYDLSPDRTAIVYLASEQHEKDVCIVSLITFDEQCLEGEKAHFISYPEWGN